jgi:A/G-specific adenine glycosylase
MEQNTPFTNLLILWYLKNKRNLPWRKNKNPYHIWLSEIILQQTKISQGTAYYLKFIENFSTIHDLANASEEEVLKLWQGLGYYSRARNLHKTAIHISKDLNGVFPNNYNSLLKLKGVGDYTASAIASICFNEPNATVDGNVYRLLSRYFGIATAINSTKGIKEFKELAQTLLDKNDSGTHNQAMMEFGALVCTPKNPDCTNCIFNTSCFALQNDKVDQLPVKENKIKIRKRNFNYLVINSENTHTIIQQRIGKGIWENLFEFPLLESQTELEIHEIVTSEILNQFVENGSYHVSKFNNKQIVHKLSHQHLFTTFWIIDTNEPIKNAILWQNLSNFALPTLIQNFVDNYKKRD